MRPLQYRRRLRLHRRPRFRLLAGAAHAGLGGRALKPAFPHIAGALLSGGRSSRMGADKGLASFLGRPLAGRPLAALRAVFGEVLIISSEEAGYAALGARVLPDLLPGLGPLGGMHAALRACPDHAMVFAGCDMPFLAAEPLAQLAGARRSSGTPVILPSIGGRPEPLCAAFAPGLAGALEQYLRTADDLSVMAFAKAAGFSLLELGDTPAVRLAFTNVNTPEDLKRAEELCRQRT